MGWMARPVMRTTRTNFDRREARRDRRYALPSLVVKLDGREYDLDNWSLGGFHLPGKLPLKIGAVVNGVLRIAKGDSVEFSARLVRKDEATDALAFQFHDLSNEVVSRLDRALARRMAGPKRT